MVLIALNRVEEINFFSIKIDSRRSDLKSWISLLSMNYDQFVANIALLPEELVPRLRELKKAGKTKEELGLFAKCVYVTHFPLIFNIHPEYYHNTVLQYAIRWSLTL